MYFFFLQYDIFNKFFFLNLWIILGQIYLFKSFYISGSIKIIIYNIMIAEISIEGFQPMTNFNEESLFKLQCLIKATNIQHSAQCEYGKRLFLALTTGNAEIFLYYKKNSTSIAIIRRIPWFQGSHKQISALCFHSMGSWLLSTSVDGSVYIIPALCFVDENCEKDKRWTSDDITSFPSISSQSSHSKYIS